DRPLSLSVAAVVVDRSSSRSSETENESICLDDNGRVHDDEDDSPVEEVSPVKPKKPLRRAIKDKKDEPKEAKEAPKEWTMKEEIACAKETGSSRGYDSIVSKWKNNVRPRIGAFCTIIKNIEANHESDVEMPYFYQTHWRKKSKTSETTLGSASGGLSLNEEADEAV
nr:hypothetical protein [Tanacetum cinerariifolium]